MTEDDLNALLPRLEEFHARFHPFFVRAEGRELSRQYLVGLNLPIERKNVENIAERVGARSRNLQLWLSDSPWDDAGCRVEMQHVLGEQFGAPNGVLILDDTGFEKKGVRSAGVGRQYSGTLGRTDNCQVGVFAGYASEHGHSLVDCRLYLTKGWLEDPDKRNSTKAAVPAGVEFKTKLVLAREMLGEIVANGQLPSRWVTADEFYGDDHDLRQKVEDLELWYCFEVSKDTEVWREDPQWEVPATKPGRGRPPSRKHPGPDSKPAERADELIRSLPQGDWIRHRVVEGAKGPREYEFVRLRVIEKIHGEPGRQSWLMARRPVDAGPEDDVKFYLSNAPETVALPEMAWVACLRWTVEEDFQLAKGQVGLDQYEVTKYRGWYHHMTMCLLALCFLKVIRAEWGKKRGVGIDNLGLGPGGASAA